MSYKVNKVAKFELENFLCVVEIFVLEALLIKQHGPKINRQIEDFNNILNFFNPLLPIAHKSARFDKISILKLEGIIKKISYERRDYESVDEKSRSKAMSRKTKKKKIQALNG